MQTLSATDLAIAVAIKADTLVVQRCQGRFGEYLAICDDTGVIEVALTDAEAWGRIDAIGGRIQ